MMKKLFAIALVTLSFTACNKTDSDQHCWACYHSKTTTDKQLVQTTTVDTTKLCDMTPQEIQKYENTYKARELDQVKYSDMHCLQQPDKE